MAKKTYNKSEFEQKIIDIRRTARVVAGGRRFSFRVALIAGNKKGEVGFGVGKSSDIASASEKAFREAKKTMFKVELTKDFSICGETEAKSSSARIILKPASAGRGLIAGSATRIVLDLAGVKNIVAKVLSRSKNKINIARATIVALKKLKQCEITKSNANTAKLSHNSHKVSQI